MYRENIGKLKELRRLYHLLKSGRMLDYFITEYIEGKPVSDIKESFKVVLQRYNLKI